MPEDLGDEGMAEGVDTTARHTFTKERQPQVMSEQSYHRPNQQFDKTVLRIISDRLKTKAEELLAEEQASFRSGWITVEQIINSLVITEKHLQNQRNLFHNFMAFKKAFDRVSGRSVACHQKFQHRGRTGSSHSETI